MPTVVEIKCELLRKGLLKGTSGFNKAQLQEVLDMSENLRSARRKINQKKGKAATKIQAVMRGKNVRQSSS
jgi:hypothetical protein